MMEPQFGFPGRYDNTFIVQLAIAALTRCTVLDPTRHSRAVFNIPLPLASEARIASSIFGSTRARPIGLPLLVPFSRALAMPALMRS